MMPNLKLMMALQAENNCVMEENTKIETKEKYF